MGNTLVKVVEPEGGCRVCQREFIKHEKALMIKFEYTLPPFQDEAIEFIGSSMGIYICQECLIKMLEKIYGGQIILQGR